MIVSEMGHCNGDANVYRPCIRMHAHTELPIFALMWGPLPPPITRVYAGHTPNHHSNISDSKPANGNSSNNYVTTTNRHSNMVDTLPERLDNAISHTKNGRFTMRGITWGIMFQLVVLDKVGWFRMKWGAIILSKATIRSTLSKPLN